MYRLVARQLGGISLSGVGPFFNAVAVYNSSTSVECTSMYVVVEPRAQHSTAQRNHPCTKQQTKYVPIRVRIKRSVHIHACGVPFVFLEHGDLGIESRLLAPKMLEHLRTTYVRHSNPFILVSECSG